MHFTPLFLFPLSKSLTCTHQYCPIVFIYRSSNCYYENSIIFNTINSDTQNKPFSLAFLLRITDNNTSKFNSLVTPMLLLSSYTLFLFISNPTTEYFAANNLANGNPTYPNPIIAIFLSNT